MASRKKLKKIINNTFGELYADCIFYKMYVIDSNADSADELIKKIVSVHNDLLARMNVTEGKKVKGRVKAFYKNLRTKLEQEVNGLGKEIAKLP